MWISFLPLDAGNIPHTPQSAVSPRVAPYPGAALVAPYGLRIYALPASTSATARGAAPWYALTPVPTRVGAMDVRLSFPVADGGVHADR